jgi:glycosyltransferase involved in cell wall biosynthesis
LRVLQVHTRYRQPGGEDTVVASERRLLETAGHVVETVDLHNPEGTWEASREMLLSPWNRGAADRVVSVARGFAADVVHVHNTWFALSPAVFPALKEAGFPTVATVHNYRLACVNAMFYRDGRICTDCLGGTPWPGVRHACYRDSRLQSAMVASTITVHRRRRTWAKDIDVVIALTDFAREVLERSGVPAERIVVKPNTLADSGPRSSSPSRSDVFLFVGRLSEEKGVQDLVAAWEIAPPAGRLVLVGDGPLGAELTRHVGPNLELRGALSHPETLRLMASARVLVQPSRVFEGLPMVLVEAAAQGTPSVVPAHGALTDVVGAGGWSFESGSVESLAAVLARLTDAEVDRVGSEARAVFLDRYSDATGLSALENVYEAAQTGRRA